MDVEERVMPKGLYIHIPFCDHICTYCDFPKLMTKGQQPDNYLSALIKELENYKENIGFESLETLYIGGGTPTALSMTQLGTLFDYLRRNISFEKLKEISIEANPENLTEEKVIFLKNKGITRISLGVQTFDEELLKKIGRKHDLNDVKQAINDLKKQGLTNINLDLIYGIPGQTLNQVKSDLEIAMSLDIVHISAYSLIVEEHTKLYLDYMKDKWQLTDNEIEAQMYELAIDYLEDHGFKQYEISNFTKELPSIHNKWYWLNQEYIGVGLGAHGYVSGNRYQNTRSITSYIQTIENGKLPIIESHEVSPEERIEEEMFLGLRLTQGVNINAVSEKFNVNIEELYKEAIEFARSRDYVLYEEGWLRLTKAGLLMANEVFEQFLLD